MEFTLQPVAAEQIQQLVFRQALRGYAEIQQIAFQSDAYCYLRLSLYSEAPEPVCGLDLSELHQRVYPAFQHIIYQILVASTGIRPG